jgi:hypothetical protein
MTDDPAHPARVILHHRPCAIDITIDPSPYPAARTAWYRTPKGRRPQVNPEWHKLPQPLRGLAEVLAPISDVSIHHSNRRGQQWLQVTIDPSTKVHTRARVARRRLPLVLDALREHLGWTDDVAIMDYVVLGMTLPHGRREEALAAMRQALQALGTLEQVRSIVDATTGLDTDSPATAVEAVS